MCYFSYLSNIKKKKFLEEEEEGLDFLYTENVIRFINDTTLFKIRKKKARMQSLWENYKLNKREENKKKE